MTWDVRPGNFLAWEFPGLIISWPENFLVWKFSGPRISGVCVLWIWDLGFGTPGFPGPDFGDPGFSDPGLLDPNIFRVLDSGILIPDSGVR